MLLTIFELCMRYAKKHVSSMWGFLSCVTQPNKPFLSQNKIDSDPIRHMYVYNLWRKKTFPITSNSVVYTIQGSSA